MRLKNFWTRFKNKAKELLEGPVLIIIHTLIDFVVIISCAIITFLLHKCLKKLEIPFLSHLELLILESIFGLGILFLATFFTYKEIRIFYNKYVKSNFRKKVEEFRRDVINEINKYFGVKISSEDLENLLNFLKVLDFEGKKQVLKDYTKTTREELSDDAVEFVMYLIQLLIILKSLLDHLEKFWYNEEKH
jgi:hypothetical protein